MGEKRKMFKASKPNSAIGGKRGFTLAELCVVLALVAISSAMIISFSASMSQFADSTEAKYEFLEDCATVKDELSKWIAEQDRFGEDLSGMHEQNFAVSKSVLTLDENTKIKNIDTVEKITLYVKGDLVKCTIKSADSDSVKSYVFALRCAKTSEEGGK